MRQKNFLITKNLIKSKKCFYKLRAPVITLPEFTYFSIILSKFYFIAKPYKLFIEGTSLFGTRVYIPGIKSLNPGTKVCYHPSIYLGDGVCQILGLCCEIKYIPYHFNICYVQSMVKTKYSFVKASGATSKRIKSPKKIKLLTITLPSIKNYLISKNCQAFVGSLPNFRKQKLVEGKWGFSFSKYKKISVRGIAKNPVDHPNGGRANSCKPEKSP